MKGGNMRVELKDGHYAVLREAEEVRGSLRRMMTRATDSAPGAASKDVVYTDTLIAALLIEWDLDLDLPSCRREKGQDIRKNYESFEALWPSDYNALRDAASEVYGESSGIVVDPDDNTDPTTPTEPLSA
jgi:hypothetical protein